LPQAWIERAEQEAGYKVPGTLSEEAPAGRPNPGAIGSVVADIKRRFFPILGADPGS
jgi:hypothetical protein